MESNQLNGVIMSNKINLEELIKQLEESEKERGYSEEFLDFNDIEVGGEEISLDDTYSYERLKQLIEEINRTYCVSLDTPVPGGKIKRFIKRALRKIFLPVIRPMNEQQVAFNAAVVQCLNQIFLYIENNGNALKISNDQGDKMNMTDIYKRLDEIEKEEEELSTRLLSLEEK